jgi:hypothetical protein
VHKSERNGTQVGGGTQGARLVKQEVHTIGSLTATGAVIADDFSQPLKHRGTSMRLCLSI